jgi:site-specific recombinase XerD
VTADYLALFGQHLTDTGRSQNTVKAYLSDLRGLVAWLQTTYDETAFEPRSITERDVIHYRAYLQTVRGCKPATINRCLKAISAFCECYMAKGWLTANPAGDAPTVKEAPAPPKALDRVDVNRLLRAVHKEGIERDIAIVELMLGTGLRVGEVAALTLTDVAMSDRRGSVTVRQGKGGKFRTVPLNSDVRKALGAYLQVRKPCETAALFLSRLGGHLSSVSLWRLVRKYGEAAGMPDLHPHALRHTFGTMLVRELGTDLVATAQLMGHSSVQTTALYAKASMKDLEDAVERLSLPGR